MAATMSIKGMDVPQTVHTDDQFLRLVDEQMGPDAAMYIEDMMSEQEELARQLIQENPRKYCNGECDKLYGMQEHYTDMLKELAEDIAAIYSDHLSLRRPHHLDAIARVLQKARRMAKE